MKAKIQVDGSVHRALKRLEYYGGVAGAMKIRSHQWSNQQDLAKCLRYGLMEHEHRGPYKLTYEGVVVLERLEMVYMAKLGRAHRPPWEKSYRDNPFGYGVPYRLGSYLITEVPGNQKWIEYFQEIQW